MCSSACKHARPGSPCHCNCRRQNHGKFYGRYPDYEWRSRSAPRFVSHEFNRPRPIRSRVAESKPPTVGPRRSLASLLKPVVVGISCAAIPSGCPAILALGKITDLFSAARAIVSRIRASRNVVGTLKHSLLSYLAGEVAHHAAGPISRLVTDEIAARIPTAGMSRANVHAIVSSTVSGITENGLKTLASWGVSDQ